MVRSKGITGCQTPLGLKEQNLLTGKADCRTEVEGKKLTLINLTLAQPSAGGLSCSGEAVSRTLQLIRTVQAVPGEQGWSVITGMRCGQHSEKLPSCQIVRGFAPRLENVNLNIQWV